MKILFATDGSEAAAAARQFLASLPLEPGSAIQVTTVIEELAWAAPPWVVAAEQEWGGKQAGEAVAALQRDGVTITPAIRRGAVAGEILRAADEFAADLIVVGSEGHTGVAGFLLGSVARNVAKHACRPVLVARAPQNGLKRVVVAVDESEHAAQAVKFARHLPLPEGTEFVVASVARPYHPYLAISQDFNADMVEVIEQAGIERRAAADALTSQAARALAEAKRPVTPAVREGDPATEILNLVAEQEADLVVAGARGVSAIQGLLVGSVADRLLKTARCSVLIVH